MTMASEESCFYSAPVFHTLPSGDYSEIEGVIVADEAGLLELRDSLEGYSESEYEELFPLFAVRLYRVHFLCPVRLGEEVVHLQVEIFAPYVDGATHGQTCRVAYRTPTTATEEEPHVLVKIGQKPWQALYGSLDCVKLLHSPPSFLAEKKFRKHHGIHGSAGMGWQNCQENLSYPVDEPIRALVALLNEIPFVYTSGWSDAKSTGIIITVRMDDEDPSFSQFCSSVRASGWTVTRTGVAPHQYYNDQPSYDIEWQPRSWFVLRRVQMPRAIQQLTKMLERFTRP